MAVVVCRKRMVSGFSDTSVQRNEQARSMFAFVYHRRGQPELVQQLRVLLPVGLDNDRPPVRERAGVRFGTIHMQLAEPGMHAADMALRRTNGLQGRFGRSELFGVQQVSVQMFGRPLHR